MLTTRLLAPVAATIWFTTLMNAGTSAYQIQGVQAGGRVIPLAWQSLPVRYFVTDRGAGGVSSADLQGAVQRSFATWEGVSQATVSATFAGFTSANPFDDDGISTLGFLNRPDLDRVLGATDYLIDDVTGAIVESDIYFNSAFQWSVAAAGEAGKFDLQSIATHEIGHFFGLGHSALGETELRPDGGRRVIAAESVLFPIAFSAGTTLGRTLRADDIAGISELYPAVTERRSTGLIAGTVTKNGAGVFGAHVVTYNPVTGTLVGGLTLDSTGRFAIGGLSPGPHIIRVEPLDDADLDSFFNDTSGVDVDFRVAFSERLAVAPRGGTSASVVVQVEAK